MIHFSLSITVVDIKFNYHGKKAREGLKEDLELLSKHSDTIRNKRMLAFWKEFQMQYKHQVKPTICHISWLSAGVRAQKRCELFIIIVKGV